MNTQDNHSQETRQTDNVTNIYVVTKEDVDSYNGRSTKISYHATFDSAMESLPDFVKKDLVTMERECYGKQVRNYTYRAIEKHELQGIVEPVPEKPRALTRLEKTAEKISLTETFRRLRINNTARREMGQAKELSNVSKNLIIHLLNAEKEPLRRRINAQDLRSFYDKWIKDIGPGDTAEDALGSLRVRVEEMNSGHLKKLVSELFDELHLYAFAYDTDDLRRTYIQWVDNYERGEG